MILLLLIVCVVRWHIYLGNGFGRIQDMENIENNQNIKSMSTIY